MARATHPALYLNADSLLRFLGPAQALSAIERFFLEHPRTQVAVPTRIHLPVPSAKTMGLYMPAATRDYVGVKIVHLMPERRPSVEAEVFLYEAQTGKLLFWGDGKPLTALRTAAVSTAATLALRPELKHLVVFGAGVQAAAHIQAMRSAYPGLSSITALVRTPQSFERLLELLPEPDREAVKVAEEPEVVLAQADCVIATTPAAQPLFAWDALKTNCHVVGVGSATPAMNELPAEAFIHSRVWVDTVAALKEAGDCLNAEKKGWESAQYKGDLFDLLGTEPPSAEETPTLFKSVGHAAQDLAILIQLWETAKEKGLAP